MKRGMTGRTPRVLEHLSNSIAMAHATLNERCHVGHSWALVEILLQMIMFHVYWAQVYIKMQNVVQQEPRFQQT